MRRRVKVAAFLASGAVVLLVAALLAAPRLRARVIEASLPPDPAARARPGDWVTYRLTRSFAVGGRAEQYRRYLAGPLSIECFSGESESRVVRELAPVRESFFDALFPRTRSSLLATFDVSDEPRVLRGRTFPCKRVSAHLGDGDMKRTVSYWLTPDVKLMGYIARSVVYLNGNSEEEEVLGYGTGDTVEWGERP